MNHIKTIFRFLFFLIGSVLLGTALLCLVFLLPTDVIFLHAKEAVRAFSIEKSYPLIDGTEATQLDNWTDALMLSNASFRNENSGLLEQAMDIYRPGYESKNPTEDMISYSLGRDPLYIASYSRYWHGYLVILKPVLAVIGYLEIRGINKILQPLLILVIAVVLWRRHSPHLLLPLTAAYLFLRPEALAFSMQFSTVFYISMLAVLSIALFYDWLSVENRLPYFFLLVGVLTNYIDFLTYPIASLGIPMGAWLCLTKKHNCLTQVKQIVICSVSWAFGYFGMWIGKWIIGSILLKRNIIADALINAQIRSSADIGTGMVSRSMVVLQNVRTGTAGHLWLVPVVLTIVLAVGFWQMKGQWKKIALHMIPFLLVAMMPVVWYSVIRNHSFLHHWFTYRALAVSVFTVIGMGVTWKDKDFR